MILPQYTFEYNDGMHQNALMQSAIRNYIPTGFGVFKNQSVLLSKTIQ